MELVGCFLSEEMGWRMGMMDIFGWDRISNFTLGMLHILPAEMENC